MNEIKELVCGYCSPFTGQLSDITEVRRGSTVLHEGGSMSDITVRGILSRNKNDKLIEEAAQYHYNQTQKMRLGRPVPDSQIGWRSILSSGNINFNFLFSSSFSGIVLSGTQLCLNAYGISKTPAEARDVEGVMINDKLYDIRRYHNTIKKLPGYYSYDTTNIRLQEIPLSYSLDGKHFCDKVERVTLGVIGTNLWMIYNKTPFDPQLIFGVGTYAATEFFMTPSAAIYGISLRIQF